MPNQTSIRIIEIFRFLYHHTDDTYPATISVHNILWRYQIMLTEREINKIAINHANISKTEHYYLEFLFVKPSAFLDGYWMEKLEKLVLWNN